MSDPFSTLLELDAIQLSCDEIQQWINFSREAFHDDQWIQLVMDRKQAEIDERRKQIQLLMLDISRRN